MVIIDGHDSPARPLRLTTTIAAAVERAEVLDAPAEALSKVASVVRGSGRRQDLLSGTWLGHPVHPLLVALPIGFYSAASLLDGVGQRRAARTMVGAGILATVPTAATGMSDWSDTTGAERRVGVAHMAANTVSTLVYAGSWLARRKGHHGRGALYALVGAMVAGAGGWLGGHLSYALGVGVDTNAFDGGPTQWTALEGEVPFIGPAEGTAVAGRADGTAVVVATTGGKPRALADRCSHRGGPLSGGEVSDGCISCPWHGSRFDLVTGEVVEGPAVVPQPAFDLRREVDHWEVRRDEERSLRRNPV